MGRSASGGSSRPYWVLARRRRCSYHPVRFRRTMPYLILFTMIFLLGLLVTCIVT